MGTQTMQDEQLWTMNTLAAACGLSSRQLRQLVARDDGPKPKGQRDGQDVFDATELVTWLARVRPMLRSGK